jgi:RNA polymerase sigma-70 factor (ECF subfamily)
MTGRDATLHPREERFRTTDWSLVVAAGSSQDPGSREALERLCTIYWYPVYGFFRWHGHDASAAQDLTQEFFTRLIENRSIGVASRERGRFRSFLLASARNFLANQRDHDRAAKRGGGHALLPLDLQSGEIRYSRELVDDRTPDKVFEKRWALAVLERTLERLREEAGRRESPERFALLSRFLTDVSPDASYRQVAGELGSTESAVKAAVHRMRKRFGQLLRDEVGRTVDDPGRIDEEIRYLFAALDGP